MRTNTTVLCGLIVACSVACSDDEPEAASRVAALMSADPSILVDLDPTSTGTTVTVENMTAGTRGVLFTSDRESGNVLRIIPNTARVEVVGKIEDRTDGLGMPLKANGAGLVALGSDLLIASASFSEIVRLAADDIDAANPGLAQTFITGVAGANAIAVDGDELFVTGGNTGNVYKAATSGGAAEVWAHIEASSRTVAPNDFMQTVVANGLALDPDGALLVADTARAAIWRIPRTADGSAGTPEMLVQSSLLEGVDGIAFDSQGRLWGAVNERNALAVIEDGEVTDAFKNDNAGPLEFPSSVVFVGDVGYVTNFDRARAENLAADGTTSSAGIGSSIARFGL